MEQTCRSYSWLCRLTCFCFVIIVRIFVVWQWEYESTSTIEYSVIKILGINEYVLVYCTLFCTFCDDNCCDKPCKMDRTSTCWLTVSRPIIKYRFILLTWNCFLHSAWFVYDYDISDCSHTTCTLVAVHWSSWYTLLLRSRCSGSRVWRQIMCPNKLDVTGQEPAF